MTAPELPEPDMHDNGDVLGNDLTYGYTAQMHAFYRQGYAAGMEQAAVIASNYFPSEVYDPERGIQENTANEIERDIRAACKPELTKPAFCTTWHAQTTMPAPPKRDRVGG
jgi:hypothetical protein